MAATKRTKFQREKDLQTTASLYLQGHLQVQIAEKIGVNQTQVSYDLRTIQKRWQESSIVNYGARKGAELAKINELERVYWDAWRKSCEGKDGNPSFLAGVQWCIMTRCNILGLNAPKRVTIETVESFLDSLPPELGVFIRAVIGGADGPKGLPSLEDSQPAHGENGSQPNGDCGVGPVP